MFPEYKFLNPRCWDWEIPTGIAITSSKSMYRGFCRNRILLGVLSSMAYTGMSWEASNADMWSSQ